MNIVITMATACSKYKHMPPAKDGGKYQAT